MHRPYDEFSLQLSWTDAAAPPGFYLRAAFTNEGTAAGVVKGTWNGGSPGNGSLVSGRFLQSLFDLMDEEGVLEPWAEHDDLGHYLATFQEQRQEAALAAKRARIVALRREIEALEQELGS